MNDAVKIPAKIVADRGRAATRVLAVLRVLGERGAREGAPDVACMGKLLAYIEKTVRGVHFGLEERLLGKRLEALRPDLRPMLGRLRRNHVGVGGYCHRTREALDLWQKGWPAAADMYLDNARDHLRLSAAHGILIRHFILPAAEAAFTPAHWQEVASACAAASADPSADPLTGCTDRTRFEAALRRMTGCEAAEPRTARSFSRTVVGARP